MRPVIYVPQNGQAITLDELAEFVADAMSRGVPGSTPVRAAGVLEVNLTHGPRIARLTADPSEAPS